MPTCSRCDDRFFSSWRAYNQHIENSFRHYPCTKCLEDFPNWSGLKQHWVESPNHDYCQYCKEEFNSARDLETHYARSHWYCSSCNKAFKYETGLQEHYRRSAFHHYCTLCKRDFKSASNLTSHLNSSVHQSKHIKCPSNCGAAFVSISALMLHAENGACPSGVNRNVINQYVRQLDTNNVITDPARMITNGSDPSQDVTTYIATNRSWNGSAYQCCLCYSTHNSLLALNRHLASPRHQDQMYICRGPGCATHFTTLSGLVQHIESGKCGMARHRSVQTVMDRLFGRMEGLRLTF